MPVDHYAALGVPPDSDTPTIRAAYRAVMRVHHPDRRPGDADSAARVIEANAAWAVLRDAARRDAYDRQRGLRSVARRTGDGVVHLSAPPAARGPAYSADRAHYQRQFSTALLRIGLVIFAVGTLLLLAFRPA